MVLKRLIPLSCLCAGFIGCSTVTDPDMQTDHALRPPSLPAQSLIPGDCGLFVWTADRLKRFILFSSAQTDNALWAGPDGQVALNITEKKSVPHHGQYPQQDFTTPDNHRLNLKLENPEVVTGGTRFTSGTLKLQTPEAWERITPVVAIATCQPYPS